jgi:hypothetical protein
MSCCFGTRALPLDQQPQQVEGLRRQREACAAVQQHVPDRPHLEWAKTVDGSSELFRGAAYAYPCARHIPVAEDVRFESPLTPAIHGGDAVRELLRGVLPAVRGVTVQQVIADGDRPEETSRRPWYSAERRACHDRLT